ncbi:BRO-N domain-containing protein [Virgibacillus alimentarius]|uniref:BRO-N domain-containing protein n=1 Tax=Virgibacillus alimentarius TaxID=698769 RepID=UPI000A87058D|nr:BRO family protein [Virgibacillus alimentarius]
MNKLQIFENELFKVSAKTEGEQILFDVEQVAKSLGFTQTKNNKEYIRWETVNKYLEKFVSQQVGKGDLIPEPLVYKLAFKAQNDVAEKFQDWLAVEVIPSIRKTGSYKQEIDTTQLSPELQMMNQMFQAVAKNELATKEAKELAIQATNTANNISNIVTMTSDEWREKVKVILRKIAQKWSGIEPYRSVINLSYERLEKRANCKLDIRLNNRKERALAQGMTKSYIKKINKLDCIAEEKRLIEIYIQVVKEMAIQHKININDFKFQEVI